MRARRCGFLPQGSQDHQYKEQAGRELLVDAAPVTGSLLFYAPVFYFAVCGAAEFLLSVLFGGTACIWLADSELFFRQVGVSSVMAADSFCSGGGPGWHHVWC